MHYYYTPSHIHTYTTLYTILLQVLQYYSYILYCYYTLPYSITSIHLHTILTHTDSQMQTLTLFILLLTALPLQHAKTSYCTTHTLSLSHIQLILFTYCTTTAYCTSTPMCIQTITQTYTCCYYLTQTQHLFTHRLYDALLLHTTLLKHTAHIKLLSPTHI